MKLPKTLGACADKLYTLRKKRIELQGKVDDMHAEEKELREHIINLLPKSDATGVAGRLARATITKKVVPTVKDWDKLYAYVLKTKEVDLLQRRVSQAAAVARWEHGEEIPGVEKFVHVDVSVTKIS